MSTSDTLGCLPARLLRPFEVQLHTCTPMTEQVASNMASRIYNDFNGTKLGPADGALSSFTIFSELPSELRVQIWKETFVPRRIILHRYRSRPPLGLRTSPTRLLLVNKEGHHCFLENYASCFRDPQHGKGRPVYINYALDTLFLKKGLPGLRQLVLDYPAPMRNLQWLELKVVLGQVALWFKDPSNYQELLPSLKLITVSGGDKGQRVPETSVILSLEALKQKFWAKGQYIPKIALLFAPSEVLPAGVKFMKLDSGSGNVIGIPYSTSLVFKEISPETYARFLVDIDKSAGWNEDQCTWPSISESAQLLAPQNLSLTEYTRLLGTQWFMREIAPFTPRS